MERPGRLVKAITVVPQIPHLAKENLRQRRPNPGKSRVVGRTWADQQDDSTHIHMKVLYSPRFYDNQKSPLHVMGTLCQTHVVPQQPDDPHHPSRVLECLARGSLGNDIAAPMMNCCLKVSCISNSAEGSPRDRPSRVYQMSPVGCPGDSLQL